MSSKWAVQTLLLAVKNADIQGLGLSEGRKNRGQSWYSSCFRWHSYLGFPGASLFFVGDRLIEIGSTERFLTGRSLCL